MINSPAGFEKFMRAVSEPAPRVELPPAGRHGDPAHLAATAAEQGIEAIGPRGDASRGRLSDPRELATAASQVRPPAYRPAASAAVACIHAA